MTTKIQTSLHGQRIGLDVDNRLLVKDETNNQHVVVADPTNEAVVVSKTGLTMEAHSFGPLKKLVFTFADMEVTMADEAGVVAYGGQKLVDLPAGYVYFQGASMDLDLTLSAAGIDADWNGDIAVGTVTASNNATLATTEQNIIPTTATPQAVASATTGDAVSTATEHAIVDGSSTAVDIYLNILVDDVDHDVTTTPTNIIVNGTLTIIYLDLGDN